MNRDDKADLSATTLSAEYIDRLGRELMILENPKAGVRYTYPFRDDTMVSLIVLSGEMTCVVDAETHLIDRQGLLIVLPSQIVEEISFGADFKGYCLVMSASFLANMPMGNQIPLMTHIRQHVFYPMTDQMVGPVVNFIAMIQGTCRTSNRYQQEIVTHLTIAYYYGLGTYLHDIDQLGDVSSRYDRIANEFLVLVRENCRARRDMGFYADALHLSAKHIALVVKATTGVTAMKWIERQTVLNAKSLLLTTDLTVGEISDKLSFPSPSDFGKYFKKFTGLSPREFRKIGR